MPLRLLFFFALSLSFDSISFADQHTPVTLSLNFRPQAQHAALAYGLDKGFYAEEGIDLTIVPTNGTGFAFKDLMSEKSRFIWIPADWVATSVSNDSAPVKVISTHFILNQFGMVFLADRISKPQDLKGKVIGLAKSGSPGLLYPLYFGALGIKMSEVTLKLLEDPNTWPGALDDGTIDAIGTSTGNLPFMRSQIKGKVGWFSYSDYIPVPGDGIVVKTKYMKSKEDRDLNCRMVRATTRAFKAAIKDPDGAVASLLKVFKVQYGGKKGQTPEMYKEGWVSRITPLITSRAAMGHPIGYSFKQDWQATLELMKKYHLIEKIKPMDDYFTNEYMSCAEQAK